MTGQLKVIIAGGSGSLGQTLAADLTQAGHQVVILTRKYGALPYEQVIWDGRSLGDWTSVLSDPDRDVVMINLAGKLVDVRPTQANIAALRDSRVAATQVLVEASQQLEKPIAHWVQASTTAIFSDAGEERITENSPVPYPGLPQMTGVARPWEDAVVGANTDHLVVLRTSIVLDRGAPALERLLGLARLGLGGPVGNGKQWFSWVHVADWLSIVRASVGLVDGVTIPAGPLIAASEHPVRNAELMKSLRRAVKRPIGLPAPAPLVHLGTWALRSDPALGLTGRHCTSQVLRDLGWTYRFPTLDAALADLVP